MYTPYEARRGTSPEDCTAISCIYLRAIYQVGFFEKNPIERSAAATAAATAAAADDDEPFIILFNFLGTILIYCILNSKTPPPKTTSIG